jgi:hypothetical protein
MHSLFVLLADSESEILQLLLKYCDLLLGNTPRDTYATIGHQL